MRKPGDKAQANYDAEQIRLRLNDVQLGDLVVGLCGVLYTKPLESNFRKTDEITVKTLYDLSCDLRKEWQNLALVLGVRDLTSDLVDETNQNCAKTTITCCFCGNKGLDPKQPTRC